MIRKGASAGKWADLEPEEALIVGILQQACQDALQTANERLQAEAWEFLNVCAPDVADKLRQKHCDNQKELSR